jgi:hypothetical protein
MLRKLLGAAGLAAVFGLLAGCSGSSATTDNTAGGSQTGGGNTPAIQGIATPSSVSVVTANNSN